MQFETSYGHVQWATKLNSIIQLNAPISIRKLSTIVLGDGGNRRTFKLHWPFISLGAACNSGSVHPMGDDENPIFQLANSHIESIRNVPAQIDLAVSVASTTTTTPMV